MSSTSIPTPQRERVIAKDLANIFGCGRSTAFKYYRQIKVAKQQRAELKGQRPGRSKHVFVDDLVEHFGLSRDAVKAGLVS